MHPTTRRADSGSQRRSRRSDAHSWYRMPLRENRSKWVLTIYIFETTDLYQLTFRLPMERGFTEILVFVQVLALFFPSAVLPLQRFSWLPPRSCDTPTPIPFILSVWFWHFPFKSSQGHMYWRWHLHLQIIRTSGSRSILSYVTATYFTATWALDPYSHLVTVGQYITTANDFYLDFMISFTVSILARSYFGSCYILVEIIRVLGRCIVWNGCFVWPVFREPKCSHFERCYCVLVRLLVGVITRALLDSSSFRSGAWMSSNDDPIPHSSYPFWLRCGFPDTTSIVLVSCWPCRPVTKNPRQPSSPCLSQLFNYLPIERPQFLL